MPGEGFDISVTSSEVLVKQDGSLQSGTSRGITGVFTILAAAYLFVRTIVFDKHGGPGLWHDFKTVPHDSFYFHLLTIFVPGVLIFTAYLLLIGVRLFFPAGEELQCDRTIFTYSMIPWVSLGGRWKRRSFPIADVSELMYGVIKSGSSDKSTPDVYGVSFYVGEKEYKVLAGLEAPDADDILKKLRTLGVDVIVNQDMSKLIEQTTEERNSRLGVV